MLVVVLTNLNSLQHEKTMNLMFECLVSMSFQDPPLQPHPCVARSSILEMTVLQTIDEEF
jgi:hypothetical protein